MMALVTQNAKYTNPLTVRQRRYSLLTALPIMTCVQDGANLSFRQLSRALTRSQMSRIQELWPLAEAGVGESHASPRCEVEAPTLFVSSTHTHSRPEDIQAANGTECRVDS